MLSHTTKFSNFKKPPSHIFHKMFRHAALANDNFLEEILKSLIIFSKANNLKLYMASEAMPHTKKIVSQYINKKFEILQYKHAFKETKKSFSSLEQLMEKIFWAHIEPDLPNFTQVGSFWTNDTSKPIKITRGNSKDKNIYLKTKFKSLAIIPVLSGKNCAGILEIGGLSKNFFNTINMDIFENTAQIMGVGIHNWQTQSKLRERVKELSCLQKINQIAGDGTKSLNRILQEFVEFIPLAWQHNNIAVAEITLDGFYHNTENFEKCKQKQDSLLIINGKTRGKVEVGYTKSMPKSDEGPFLKEEKNLLEIITRQIAFIIERKDIEQDRLSLQEKLRHADRLATIGQFVSSIAHELNEPLANILGYAQLAKKSKPISKDIEGDLDKIENASLHAREVIKRLLLFSRLTPSAKMEIDINLLVDESIYFFESRCAKENIELTYSLNSKIPHIHCVPIQLKQVLINLIANAIQAMPHGGKLKIRTGLKNKHAVISIEDTGTGISEKVKKKIFTPFFTTKAVGEGTGLGLAVSNEIITAHNGFIIFKNNEQKGTTFEIFLPLNSIGSK